MYNTLDCFGWNNMSQEYSDVTANPKHSHTEIGNRERTHTHKHTHTEVQAKVAHCSPV